MHSVGDVTAIEWMLVIWVISITLTELEQVCNYMYAPVDQCMMTPLFE